MQLIVVALLEFPAPSSNLSVIERSHPQAFGNDSRIRPKLVLRARLEQPQQALDDARGGVVALKVDQGLRLFAAVEGDGLRCRGDESRLLRVVDEIAGVDAYDSVY